MPNDLPDTVAIWGTGAPEDDQPECRCGEPLGEPGVCDRCQYHEDKNDAGYQRAMRRNDAE